MLHYTQFNSSLRVFAMTSPSSANLKTPILGWLATYAKVGEMKFKGRDFFVGPSASSRLAIGISDKTRQTFLGFTGDDDVVFTSFVIASIAFVRRVQDKDWLVVVTDDGSNGRADEPIPMRIWFPANAGLFDGWAGIPEHASVQLIRVTDDNMRLSDDSVDIIESVPLTLQGNWKGVEVIEEPDEDDLSLVPEEAEIETSQMPDVDLAAEEEDVMAEIRAAQELGAEADASELEGIDIDALLKGS